MDYYLGVTCDLVDNWRSLLAEPEADKRLTDRIKIEDDLNKKRAALEVTAACMPFTSRITSARVLSYVGGVEIAADTEQDVVKLLCPWLVEQIDYMLEGNHFSLYGMNIRDTLRVLGAQAAVAKQPLPGYVWKFPLSNRDACYAVDPYEDFFNADVKKHVQLSHIEDALGYVPGSVTSRAMADAEYVRWLAKGLFGGSDHP